VRTNANEDFEVRRYDDSLALAERLAVADAKTALTITITTTTTLTMPLTLTLTAVRLRSPAGSPAPEDNSVCPTHAQAHTHMARTPPIV